MNKTVSIITSIVLSFALFFAYTNTGVVFAQNQSTTGGADNNKTSPQNQTSATVTGQAQTATINKTNIPAQQTTVEVNKTSKPVEGQANLKPLSNQTLQQAPSLSGIQNKSIVQATGPATTEIVNKTTVPYNQTIIGTENQSKSVQQGQQNQTSGGQQNQTSGGQQNGTANPVGGQQQQQQQNNQSKNPLEQLGSSVGNMLNGKK
jgi:hypothetical protein